MVKSNEEFDCKDNHLDYERTVRLAAMTYIARKTLVSNPVGRRDHFDRWYPAEEERCECCDTVRPPSAYVTESLETHCRTARHVAKLFGVNRHDILRIAKVITKFGSDY